MGTDDYSAYYLTYHDYFIIYANVKSICSAPETNIIVYVNYN